MSDEFDGLCVGLDTALCRPHAKIVTIEDSHKRLDSAIREALSGFDTADLVNRASKSAQDRVDRAGPTNTRCPTAKA